MKKYANNWKALSIGALAIVLLTILYQPHFSNGFYFDDWHTIQNNESIRSLDNWTSFFTDAETFSTLPFNRTYRPLLTFYNAVDYHLGKGLNPSVFHLNNYLHFLALLLGIFLLVRNLARRLKYGEWATWIALGTAVVYGFNTANAETLNYIISRSDIIAACGVVWALYLFLIPTTRKYWLFLLPFVYGLYAKQSALMFLPLCFMVQWIFVGRKGRPVKTGFRALKVVSPFLAIGFTLFVINQVLLMPASTVSFDGNSNQLQYIIGQFYVLARYAVNFVLPIDLNVDPGLHTAQVTSGIRLWIGVIVNLLLVGWLLHAIRKKAYLVVFGIAWFYIANFPTSLVPFFQITNDHRMFFPSMGLALSTVAELSHLIRNATPLKRQLTLIYTAILYLVIHGIGITERTAVWSSEISLWEDAVEKSPNNPRAQLSLGWAYFNDDQFESAETHIINAFKLHPRDPYGRIAMGLLSAHNAKFRQAERHFKFALTLYPENPDGYWYYAQYLLDRGRQNEAKQMALKGLEFSKNHSALLDFIGR